MSIYKMRTNFGTQFKFIFLGVALIFVVGAIFTFGGAPSGGPEGNEHGADQVIATVDGMPITKGEMESQWQQMSEALRDQGVRSTLQFTQQRASLFQNIVESRVTLITAQAMGVDISKKEMKAKRDELVVEYLKQNRSKVLGKLSTEQDKLDPRRDRAYKSELIKGGLSLTQLEKQANAMISDGQLSVQIASDGIRKAIERKTGTVTKEDILQSYNLYEMRQIMMQKGNTPAEQFKTKVNKVAAEAKTGNFVELAKKYSEDPEKGIIHPVSYGRVSLQIWDKLVNMKAGEVSAPIDAEPGIYIIKVESVTAQAPKKLEKKAEDERREMIKNMRQMQEYYKYDRQVRGNLKVVVSDPELNGYWQLGRAQQSQNMAEAKKQVTLARNSLEKAIGLEPNNSFATTMLAMVLIQQDDTKQATQLLYQLLEGKDSKGMGADLRIVLGDLLLKAGKKHDALKQFAKSSEEAGFDVMAHQQVMAKYQEMGRSDLAAVEKKWIDDYNEKKRIYEAQQKQSKPAAEGGK